MTAHRQRRDDAVAARAGTTPLPGCQHTTGTSYLVGDYLQRDVGYAASFNARLSCSATRDRRATGFWRRLPCHRRRCLSSNRAGLCRRLRSASLVLPCAPLFEPQNVPLPQGSDSEDMGTTTTRKRLRPSEPGSDDEGASRKLQAVGLGANLGTDAKLTFTCCGLSRASAHHCYC
ncbi:hypothetical protein MTO96_040297 [Rhipicephalus appendiculatus]